MNKRDNQVKRGKVQRVVFALLLAGMLGVGSFYAPMTMETAFACQANSGGC